MTSILAATDFSPRAELAIKRAAFLARSNQHRLDLVHVVDPDRPRALIDAEAGLSRELLERQGERLREEFDVPVGIHLFEAEPSAGIAEALDQLEPQLLVLGAYRQRWFQHTFIGTTAERSIRASGKPVLIVNRDARDDYAHIVVAVDLSEASAHALKTTLALRLQARAMLSVAHLFTAPGVGSITMASASQREIEQHVADEQALATRDLDRFLEKNPPGRVQRIVRHLNSTPAEAIEKVADELGADLLVMGAGPGLGRSRRSLGGTTLELLARGRRDMLVVPALD